jgi:hypothetical protein
MDIRGESQGLISSPIDEPRLDFNSNIFGFNDTQYNDTQYKGTRYNDTQLATLSI